MLINGYKIEVGYKVPNGSNVRDYSKLNDARKAYSICKGNFCLAIKKTEQEAVDYANSLITI